MRGGCGSLYRKYGKRTIDFLFALFLLIALSPFFIIVGLLVRVKLGTPVLFRQKRPGLNGEIFTLYKFRTMREARNESGELLPDSARLTAFGRGLRASSIDELPEFWNILKGDMSLIGPRPLAVQYLPYYTEEEQKRHTVRPGLTGLAQINGRNALDWEEKFRYDLEYVKDITFRKDVKIFWGTIRKVLEKTDIGERGVDSPIDFDLYRQKQWNCGEEKNEH